MNIFQRHSSKGFTIVELLVVIAVTALLGAIVLVGGREPAMRNDVRRDAQILAGEIRRAQTLAVSARQHECNGVSTVPHYGLYAEVDTESRASFFLYADCDRDNVFTSGTDEVIREEELDDTFIASVTPSGSDIEIVFIPPTPRVAINGTVVSFPDVDDFSIELCHLRNASLCVEVVGNTRGNVEVQ